MAEERLKWMNLVLLDETNINDIPDNTPGVYRLSYTNDEGKNYYVFYVGKSENLKQELLSIISPDFRTKNICISNHLNLGKCKFRYAVIKDSAIRDAAERQVYKFYQPPCNEPMVMVNENIIINVT
jgi:excinuclease UvrABC nuclease subunit